VAGVGARQGVLNWTGQFLALRPSSSGQRLHSESRRSRRSGRETRYRLCDHGEVCKHVLVTETVLASAFGLALNSATGRVISYRVIYGLEFPSFRHFWLRRWPRVTPRGNERCFKTAFRTPARKLRQREARSALRANLRVCWAGMTAARAGARQLDAHSWQSLARSGATARHFGHFTLVLQSNRSLKNDPEGVAFENEVLE
jgi:hypothetical protein